MSKLIHHPAIRWGLTLIWTYFTVSLMLSPSGDGTTVSWISGLFGGTEVTDAIGHVIINGILAFLWCWTISLYTDQTKTLRIVLIGGIVWGLIGEWSQSFVPERGSSLLDIGANILGIVGGVLVYRFLAAHFFRPAAP